MARNRAYRELLTGLDDDAAGAVGDSIETLSQVDITPAAWQRGTGDRAEAVRDATERAAARMASRPTGSGDRRWLAAQPRPHARAAGARRGAATGPRPVELDLARRPAPTPFSMRRTGLGVPLVVRARSRARRARRARRAGRPVPGQDRRRPGRAGGRSGRAVGGVRGVPRRHARRPARPGRRDLRHRPHQRAGHGVAAHPHLGAAPTPVAGLLRARDGRPDHDPDDHRRRPVRVADRERVCCRRWSRWSRSSVSASP